MYTRLGGTGAAIVQSNPQQHAYDRQSSSFSNNSAVDSLETLVQDTPNGSTFSANTSDHYLASGAIPDHPTVAGFLYCTFFDDEQLWTAEYGGPTDCEVSISGHVCEGGYLQGSGNSGQFFVDCTVVSGDFNATRLGAKIVVDGLVRFNDGHSMGRCTFEKQRQAGRLGYKQMATWRLVSCRTNSEDGFNALLRPKKRRFGPEYKVMTDDDWGDMDIWIALRGVAPVFDRVGVDIRPLYFAELTTTDYLEKADILTLTRQLCMFAGPTTFTQSMLDEWGDLYPNPVKAVRPKYISRIHCSHWLALYRKIMDFKIGG